MSSLTWIFIVAVTIVAFAIHVTLRTRPRNPKDAILLLAGYWIVFTGSAYFLSTMLPRSIFNTQRNVSDNWQPLISQLSGTSRQVLAVAEDISGMGEVEPLVIVDVPPDPSTGAGGAVAVLPAATAATLPHTVETIETVAEYTVKQGDTLARIAQQHGVSVGDIVAANGITNPNKILPNDVLKIPGQVITVTKEAEPVTMVEPAPAIVATVAPTPAPVDTWLDTMCASIDQARTSGDIATGKQLVTSVLETQPYAGCAVLADSEIAAAETTKSSTAVLADLAAYTDGRPEDQAKVASAMSGLGYEIIDDGNKAFDVLCEELSEVQVTTVTWLLGYKFLVPRCYLRQFGAENTGDTFSAP